MKETTLKLIQRLTKLRKKNKSSSVAAFAALTLLFLSACATADNEPSLPIFPSPSAVAVRATPTLADPLQVVPVAQVTTEGGTTAEAGSNGPQASGDAPAPVAQTTTAADAPPASADDAPTATATSSATPTPSATPIPDLPAAELIALGQKMLADGQSQIAAEVFRKAQTDPDLTANEQGESLYWLGRAEMVNENVPAAVEAFRQQLASGAPNPDTHFQLGELNLAAGNCEVALSEYTLYLDANPDMAAYLWPRMANCYSTPADLVFAYEQALTANSHYLTEVAIRRQLASWYRENGNYPAAIEQYSAIRDLAQTEQTKGEMTYQIGATYVLSDDLASGYEAYQFGLNNYPQAYESYLGLVELVGAEQPVDAYQRGVVDYYAGAYVPAIDVLTVYSDTNPTTYNPDTHLFLTWSYESISDFANALKQMDKYLATDPENPETIGTYYEEKAALETRSISVSQAISTLDAFVESYPEHPQAAWAAWRTAVLADRFQSDPINGAARYLAYAEAYPTDENVAEARYQAGVLLYQQGYQENAIEAWQLAAENEGMFGRAALVWLIDVLPEEEAAPYIAQATALTGSDYYTRRALDVANGLPPYPRPSVVNLVVDTAAEQQAAEAWLAEQLGLETVSSSLGANLQNDGRIIRGTKLWNLGAFDQGKRELEAARLAYQSNAIASYQLAVYFRDLGLYRSSILAAVSTMTALKVTVYEAPLFIARLAYPIYYADWVVAFADEYDYDPLLHFALIRQESLFEGFATSSAIAQGLSQIIPDTGVFVAQRLQWPNYSNEDLFRPYINLTFGAYYLDLQLETFDGHIAPALAAYNAGPGNALGWYDTAAGDHDLYLETVNFSETRLYIRNIYTWHAVYRYLYGR